MALVKELMGLGVPGPVAKADGISAKASALVGAGTTQAGALQLTENYNVFATVGASSGAKLPLAAASGAFYVVNSGANALAVYPAIGDRINNGTVTTGSFSVTNAKSAMFVPLGNEWFAILSA